MESLTPFIRHEPQNRPGPSGPPEETSSRVSPALGSPPEQPPVTEPPSQPDNPDVQLPPPEIEQPSPGCGSQQSLRTLGGARASLAAAPTAPPCFGRRPRSSPLPMTDGTPVGCRQKNAAEYLAGRSPGIMAQYGDGLFGAEQHTRSRQPAPDKDESGVLQLVEWREEAPYG